MTRYIFCVIAVLVQPLFVWYVYHKQDKREAALKIPMIGCSVLYLVVQVYAFFKLCIKIPGKYGIFSYLIQAVILAVFIALELALSGSNKYIKKVQENEQNSIRDFKNLIKELEICRLDISEENKKYIILMLLVLASTLRFKSIAFIPIYMYLYYIVFKKQRKLQLLDVGILCVLGGVFAISQVMEYFNNPDWARNVLTMNSLNIAKDNFPIGTGFGTYASWASGESYSNIYYDYNISTTWGISPDFYEFIADTFWPMIIGQFGVLGLGIYIYILLRIYKNIINNDNLDYYFGQILALLYLIILSIAEASFSGPIVVVYMALIAVLGNKKIGRLRL